MHVLVIVLVVTTLSVLALRGIAARNTRLAPQRRERGEPEPSMVPAQIAVLTIGGLTIGFALFITR